MNEPLEPRDDFEDIRRLVSAETDGALRRFRAGSFETNLRARIAAADRAADEAPRRFLRLRPLAVPAVVVALVLMLAGGAFLILRRGPKGGSGESGLFVKAVGLLPGLESIAAGPVVGSLARGSAPSSDNPVANVLARAYEKKRSEEDRRVPASIPAASRLSLKEKMEILFKDRALERVLSSIHEKSKEV